MSRRSFHARTIALTTALPALVATCAKTQDRIGDETHFVCQTDQDCVNFGSGLSCKAGVCRSIVDSGADSSHSADGPILRDAGFSLPPFTSLDGRSPFTGTMNECPDGGSTGTPTGQCPLPLPPCTRGSSQACWDVPQAPGSGECRPSPASDYGTRCCLGGTCGFDYGHGCTGAPLALAGQTANIPPPCDGIRGGVERVYNAAGDRPLTNLAMDDTYVYAIDRNGAEEVAWSISKSTCETKSRLRVTGGPIQSVTSAGGFVFTLSDFHLFSGPFADPFATREVELYPMFGNVDLQFGPLGSDGNSAYIVVIPQLADAGIPNASLVEIPCCNGTPRVIGTRPIGDFTGSQLVRDGDRIFVMGETFLLRADTEVTVSAFDLVSKQGITVFGGVPTSTRLHPLGVHHGRPYFAQSGRLTTVNVDSCANAAAVENRLFDAVPAFAADDHAIYWAETYGDLTASRIFMKADDSSAVVQAIETTGQVTWVGVDSTHLYWAETQEDTAVHPYVFRIALPR